MTHLRHPLFPTAATLALTVLFAIGLSLAPVPEALRPLPELQGDDFWGTLWSLALPHPRQGVPSPVPGVETGLASASATLPEAETPLPPAPPVSEQLDMNGFADLGTDTARKAAQLEALGESLGARKVELVLNCRQWDGERCAEHGLAPFFQALEGLREGSRQTPVRVVHLGDSLIASDHITDVLRERLQERHGSGGKGLLFITLPTEGGRAVRSGEASQGWRIARITDKEPPGNLGLTGASFRTQALAPPEESRFLLEGSRSAELFFLAQPQEGAVHLELDGKPFQSVHTRFTRAEAAFSRVRLPPDARELRLKTQGAVELHGLSLENSKPGVVYDSLGLPGATAEVWMRAQAPVFQAQLRKRNPALVVLMLGGNEAFRVSKAGSGLETAKEQLRVLASFVRTTSPAAACLVIAPLDAAIRTVGGELIPRRGSRFIADALRDVAAKEGCAYWDALEAMGGEGAAARWVQQGMMNEDLVHPRRRGADLIGHLLDMSLARAFEAQHRAVVSVVDRPGLLGAERALSQTFARMRALEGKAPLRLAIAQLGASHTAAHFFSDAVRQTLQARFGGAGRGYVSAGRSSPRLKAGGVNRQLEGAWTLVDALEPAPGGLWSLTGTRAVGAPGASLSLRFCENCAPSTATGLLNVAWIESPDSGELEVRIDGATVLRQAPRVGLKSEVLRQQAFVVQGPSHRVEVLHRQGGPITVLGASLEMDKPGLVYDALGLPGSTVFTARGYQTETFNAQLAERNPQLLVLWYGTNESFIPDLSPERFRREYGALIQGWREASGGAECLIIGPTDRIKRQPDGRWAEAPSLSTVLTVLPALAQEEGCAYWSSRAAMGGERSMARWQQRDPPLGQTDGVHPTALGYERLARAFVADLLDAYKSARPERAVAGGR